jgi:hypothetical protein
MILMTSRTRRLLFIVGVGFVSGHTSLFNWSRLILYPQTSNPRRAPFGFGAQDQSTMSCTSTNLPTHATSSWVISKPRRLTSSLHQMR